MPFLETRKPGNLETWVQHQMPGLPSKYRASIFRFSPIALLNPNNCYPPPCSQHIFVTPNPHGSPMPSKAKPCLECSTLTSNHRIKGQPFIFAMAMQSLCRGNGCCSKWGGGNPPNPGQDLFLMEKFAVRVKPERKSVRLSPPAVK